MIQDAYVRNCILRHNPISPERLTKMLQGNGPMPRYTPEEIGASLTRLIMAKEISLEINPLVPGCALFTYGFTYDQ